jgi:uroporphyrinogen III methyltransferase / synthase
MPAKPLQGKRIVVTRSPDQADDLIGRLQALGAEAIPFPVIQLVPLPAGALDEALVSLDAYDWLIFTSANAVRFFWERLDSRDAAPLKVRVAAGGSATADRLRSLGVEPDFIPEEFVGERLVEGLGDLTGRRVLLPRSRIGRPEIAELLRQRGARVDEIALYDTVTAAPGEEAWAALDRPIDCITFTSPSSVRNWLRLLATGNPTSRLRDQRPAIACIGPITAAEAIKNGLSADIVPAEYTIAGLVAAIAQYFVEKTNDVE